MNVLPHIIPDLDKSSIIRSVDNSNDIHTQIYKKWHGPFEPLSLYHMTLFKLIDSGISSQINSQIDKEYVVWEKIYPIELSYCGRLQTLMKESPLPELPVKYREDCRKLILRKLEKCLMEALKQRHSWSLFLYFFKKWVVYSKQDWDFPILLYKKAFRQGYYLREERHAYGNICNFLHTFGWAFPRIMLLAEVGCPELLKDLLSIPQFRTSMRSGHSMGKLAFIGAIAGNSFEYVKCLYALVDPSPNEIVSYLGFSLQKSSFEITEFLLQRITQGTLNYTDSDIHETALIQAVRKRHFKTINKIWDNRFIQTATQVAIQNNDPPLFVFFLLVARKRKNIDNIGHEAKQAFISTLCKSDHSGKARIATYMKHLDWYVTTEMIGCPFLDINYIKLCLELDAFEIGLSIPRWHKKMVRRFLSQKRIDPYVALQLACKHPDLAREIVKFADLNKARKMFPHLFPQKRKRVTKKNRPQKKAKH